MIKASEIAKIMDDVYRTTPDPFQVDDGFWEKFNPKFKKTYREKLDARKINMYGQIIPRIEIVKHNLRALKRGNTMVWRGLNVKDRRQSKDRRK